MLTAREVPGKEQRRFRRYSVNFLCEISKPMPPGRKFLAHTQDVSRGGIYCSVPVKWRVGTPVAFVLHLPLRATRSRPVALRCRGKVARVVEQEGERFGVGCTIEKLEFLQLGSRESQRGK